MMIESTKVNRTLMITSCQMTRNKT